VEALAGLAAAQWARLVALVVAVAATLCMQVVLVQLGRDLLAELQVLLILRTLPRVVEEVLAVLDQHQLLVVEAVADQAYILISAELVQLMQVEVEVEKINKLVKLVPAASVVAAVDKNVPVLEKQTVLLALVAVLAGTLMKEQELVAVV
jgi:hypothetical protein